MERWFARHASPLLCSVDLADVSGQSASVQRRREPTGSLTSETLPCATASILHT